ncbi:MAG: hypothetical protein F7B19_00985 [Desulfurococcales archaeon]|nr:hypothetical protein [Desulfurococcales archaeon]MCE4627100.1 hypothetical protein [Desulfurococcales archaeon]
MNEERNEEHKNDDVRELEGIFKAISNFIRDIQEPLQELMETLIGPIRGDKFGEELAEFYKKLKEGGIPEDLAQKMTLEYFNKRMKILDIPSSLGGILSKGPWTQGFNYKSEEEKEEEEEKETNEG